MSGSPFAPYINSVIRFEVASGQLVADPRTGIKRPGKAVVEVKAVMQAKRDPNRELRSGIDTTAVWLEGFLVEPRPLPSIVTPEARASAEWDGKKGEFFLDLPTRNPYLKALNINLVDKIKGYFQLSSFVVEGDPFIPEEGNTTNASLKIPFSFGDASPKTIYALQPGQTVFTVQIVIQTPFNGLGAALKIGDAAVSDRLMRSEQNLPTAVGEYEANPGHTYRSATDIQLTVTPGEGTTQGSGFVLLEI